MARCFLTLLIAFVVTFNIFCFRVVRWLTVLRIVLSSMVRAYLLLDVMQFTRWRMYSQH